MPLQAGPGLNLPPELRERLRQILAAAPKARHNTAPVNRCKGSVYYVKSKRRYVYQP